MADPTQQFIKRFNTIKTLPHVVTKLSALINDEDATIRDFEEVIKMDPTLVVRLLQLVNSPYYGLAQKVESIGRAVAYVGMRDLYSLAVTDAMKNMFTSEDTVSAHYSRKQLWLHSAAVGICSKVVAERIFGVNGDDPYLTGILHDFGIIVEEQVEPDLFFKVCENPDNQLRFDNCERAYLQTDHSEIGYFLTKAWDMPQAIQEAIRDHHRNIENIAPDSLTGILQIAEYLTAQLQYVAIPGFPPRLSDCLQEHISENIDEYTVLMEDLPEEMEKAKDLYSS